jgi:hypothetical protein
MLGMPGFVVLVVSDYDGEVEQAIETTADLVVLPGQVGQPADRGSAADSGVGSVVVVLVEPAR